MTLFSFITEIKCAYPSTPHLEKSFIFSHEVYLWLKEVEAAARKIPENLTKDPFWLEHRPDDKVRLAAWTEDLESTPLPPPEDPQSGVVMELLHLIKHPPDGMKPITPRPLPRKDGSTIDDFSARMMNGSIFKLWESACKWLPDFNMFALSVGDAADLLGLSCALAEHRWVDAEALSHVDTACRDYIPEDVWNFILHDLPLLVEMDAIEDVMAAPQQKALPLKRI